MFQWFCCCFSVTSILQVQVASHGEKKGAEDIAAAVDYLGRPPDKSKTGGWTAAWLILGFFLGHVL